MKAEEAARRVRDKYIEDAASVPLGDGILILSDYNRMFPHSRLDPFEVFADHPREIIESWMARVSKLFETDSRIGYVLIHDGPESDAYEKLRAEYIQQNPGFTERTYDRAIHIRANWAVF